MPDKDKDQHRGWRKKKHEKQPKTPIQSKAAGEDTSATAAPVERVIERHRPPPLDKLGWRKTTAGATNLSDRSLLETSHASRSQTPVGPAPSSTSGGNDGIEETRSEVGSAATTPGRKSTPKPKLSRYLSDYLSLSSAAKGPEFLAPWDDNSPLRFESPVDPLVSVQAVRYHIGHHGLERIPVEHSNGILRVFEDYGKVRENKEHLDRLLQETLQGFKSAEESWATTESHYQAEIRRLELLIARGSPGMPELMQVRQGTIVNRKQQHRKMLSTDQIETAFEFPERDQLDEQIRQKSQQVVFYRPSSPSGTMAALSRHFSKTDAEEPAEMPIGTPPSGSNKFTLAQKVKSELDLAKIGKLTSSTLESPSVYSTFSVAGDTLPDEADVEPAAVAVASGVECEAFVALRELAILVARRRGINADKFVSKLMNIYSVAEYVSRDGSHSEPRIDQENSIQLTPIEYNPDISKQHPKLSLRRYRSQPQLTSHQGYRRHFSFEPGEDKLGMLNEDLKNHDLNRPKSPAGSQSTRSSDTHDALSDQRSEVASLRSYPLSVDTKPSKIPSPLHRSRISRIRRENSTSSLQTMSSCHNPDDRRDSRSSVLTAFRSNSSSHLQQPQSTSSTSRSDSNNDVREAESQHQRYKAGSLRLRNSTVALAAARAAGAASRSASESQSSSPAKKSKGSFSMTSSARRSNITSERGIPYENAAPPKRW